MLWRIVALLGMGLAAYGQTQLTDASVNTRALTFGDPAWPHIVRGTLQPIALIALGALLFALAIRSVIAWRNRDVELPRIAHRLRLKRAWIIPPLALTLALWAWLLAQLWVGKWDLRYVFLWLGLLALYVASTALLDLRDGRLDRPDLRWTDLAVILAGWGWFAWVNVPTLADWYFAAQGDEYAMFWFGRTIVLDENPAINLFSQRGVYEVHHVWNGAMPGYLMKLLGTDRWGWKMAEVVNVLAAMVPFYFLARMIGGRLVAFFATAFVATSHHFFAFVHLGGNNVDALPPAIGALAFALAAERRRSWMLSGLAGVAAGLGFYTLFTGRLAIVLIGIYALVRWRAWLRTGLITPLALGFLLAIGPNVATSKEWFVLSMLRYSAAGESRTTSQFLLDVWDNTYRNIVAFHYNYLDGRYIRSGMFDPVTAVLATLGLFLVILTLRQPSRLLLLIWYVVGIFVTGGMAPVGRVAETRSHIVTMMLAIAAGLAVDAFVRMSVPRARPRLARLVAPIVALALVPTVAYANNRIFFVEDPAKLITVQESLVERSLQTTRCGDLSQAPAVIVNANYGLMGHVLESDDPARGYPILLEGRDRAALAEYTAAPCFFLMYMPEPEARALVTQLRASIPLADPRRELDPSRRMFMFVAENLAPRPEAPPVWESVRGLRWVHRYGALGNKAGQMNRAQGIAVAPGGELYVADTYNDRVQKFGAGGRLDPAWGRGGIVSVAQPRLVAIAPEGDLYALGEGTGELTRLDPAGRVLGRRPLGPLFGHPSGMAVAPDGRLLIASDLNLHVLDPESGRSEVAFAAGVPLLAADVAVTPDGQLVVVEPTRNQIAVLGPDFALLRRWPAPVQLHGAQLAPLPGGGLAALLPSTRRVVVFNRDGALVGQVEGRALGMYLIDAPNDLAVDALGYLYLNDPRRGWVAKLAPLR